MALEKIFEPIQPDRKGTVTGSPEKISVPETKLEKKTLSRQEVFSKIVNRQLEKPGVGSILATTQAQDYQKKRAIAIDNILAEGLNEVFLKMNPKQQSEFKKKGEETVIKINELLGRTKVKVSKIIDLIRSWLKLIPGVNKFFLEQEVKIKADKIIKIKDKF